MKGRIKEIEDEKYFVPAIYRGMQVLEELSTAPRGLTLSEFSGGYPVATLYRILTTLHKLGYLIREAGDRYRLSRKLLTLGNRAVNRSNLVERALPLMRELRDAGGETVLLATLYGAEGVVLAQVESNQAVKVSIRIGHHFPLHSAAPGKAMLAFLPSDELEYILEQMVFTPFTADTITGREEFEKTLKQVRRNGVAFDRGEELADIRCVAAPLLDGAGYPQGAIWLSGPASRLPNGKLRELAKIVRQCAERINANGDE